MDMVEKRDDFDVPRFDLQQMLKEIESETGMYGQSSVKQADITELFKKKDNKDKRPQS